VRVPAPDSERPDQIGFGSALAAGVRSEQGARTTAGNAQAPPYWRGAKIANAKGSDERCSRKLFRRLGGDGERRIADPVPVRGLLTERSNFVKNGDAEQADGRI
jgi:hypothetical protein